MIDLCQNFDGLIFDLDGTLADSMPLHVKAWQQILIPQGIIQTDEQILALGGMSCEATLELFEQLFNKSLDIPSLISKRQVIVDELLHQQLKPKTDVVDIAKHFLSKKPMAIATGSNKKVALNTLDQLKIRHLFDVIISASDVQLPKPNPQTYQMAAQGLGLTPHQVLVFEDTPIGLKGAKSAQMACVDVTKLQKKHIIYP